MSASAADIQAAMCSSFCDEWVRAGVTDAVVSPGSRSTPMVAALAAAGRIRVHVVLDERSAGFTALGVGLASGRPVPVVTTSGTASVELHPALVEASQARVPIVAVTTDRPPELHQVGAPQTVEQSALFSCVVWAAEPGVPDAASAASWRSLAARSVAEAVAGPGPVHLNLAFREPLLGDARRFPAPPGRGDGAPWHRGSVASGLPPEFLVDMLQHHRSRRGLIVAGHGAALDGQEAAALLEMAAVLGWPVLADPRSGCRRGELGGIPVVTAADALLRAPGFVAEPPEIVLRVGAGWASKVLGQWLAALSPDIPQLVVDRWGRWSDPDRTAAIAAAVSPALLARAVTEGLPSGETSPWAERWARAEAAAQGVFDRLLGPEGELNMSEPALARAVCRAVGRGLVPGSAGNIRPAVAGAADGPFLLASSSMPIRDVEWFGGPVAGQVLSNRGANGIDGVVSTAVGAALGGGAGVGLIGDLAFVYDAGGLLWARDREVSLDLVIPDNDGGGIFSFLPQAELLPAELFERFWGTPHGLDLVAVARSYGAEAARIDQRAALDEVLGQLGRPGVRVWVVPSDRRANVEAHARLNAEVAPAISGT